MGERLALVDGSAAHGHFGPDCALASFSSQAAILAWSFTWAAAFNSSATLGLPWAAFTPVLRQWCWPLVARLTSLQPIGAVRVRARAGTAKAPE